MSEGEKNKEEGKGTCEKYKGRKLGGAGFILVGSLSLGVWVEGVPQSKESFRDGLGCPNHRLEHRNRDGANDRANGSL